MTSPPIVTIFWFRRDLRLNDNKGLFFALKSSVRVLPLFIFDDEIIGKLTTDDPRLTFIRSCLLDIEKQLRAAGSSLLVRKGKPIEIFKQLLREFSVENVFCNADHEPYGQQRDHEVGLLLKDQGITLQSFIDHLVMEKSDVVKQSGEPYLKFTPYSRQWKGVLSPEKLRHFPSEDMPERFFKRKAGEIPSIEKIGFSVSGIDIPGKEINEQLISNYHNTRDYPAIDGTSRLGVHLRFGTISIRQLVTVARMLNETFLNELIWREFYAMILWHFPYVVDKAFRQGYDMISWRNDEAEFEKWTQGLTGYPLVDAGMRQLNAIGYMHNRLRMVTAGFLTKHLLVDWRWGETYFAGKLLDYELSSNNGGWQWCAGTGTDAAPYFRIFNPMEQQKKFDSDFEFIRQWIPEFDAPGYPPPMVDHKFARERCLSAFKNI